MNGVKSYGAALTERARAALKAAGLKGVTVASRRITYSRGLTFTVRDPATDIDAVKRVAAGFRHVDRCAVSGETLMGGNTYVDVELGPKVVEFAVSLWGPVIRACAATLPPVGTNSGRRLEDRMWVFRDRADEWKISVKGDGGPWWITWMPDDLRNIRHASAHLFEKFGAPLPLSEMSEKPADEKAPAP